jgi:hypothetical protein
MTCDGQDIVLREVVKKYNGKNWKQIGTGKTSSFLAFNFVLEVFYVDYLLFVFRYQPLNLYL